MRGRNSAVEREAATHIDSLAAEVERVAAAQGNASASVNAAAPPRTGRVPELPEQCAQCMRWVDRDRLAVVPIGASACCGLCLALDELRGALKHALPTLAEEDQIHECLFQAHLLLRRRAQDRAGR